MRPTHSSQVIGRRPSKRPVNDGRRILITHPVGPQIIHIPVLLDLFRRSLGAALPEDIDQRGVHLASLGPRVQQQYQLVAAAQRARVHLDLALAVLVDVVDEVAPLADGGGGKGVLRDGEDGGVLEDGEGGRIDLGHDVGHEEGGFEGGPEAHVSN